jgi:hypothetical protein
LPAQDEFPMVITQMRDRTAERGKPQSKKDP